MIKVEKFFKILKENKINFFSGVPDSVLKDAKIHLSKINKKNHIIAANEGSAIASSIGYYLSTGRIPCVYFQNSGLGNALNPLISIAHKKVYSIPLFLLIGWRGAPGIPDEPQHLVKGGITTKLLKLLNIKYCILNNSNDLKKIKNLLNYAKKNKTPVACLIKKNILVNTKKIKTKFKKNTKGIVREIFIKKFLKKIKAKSKIISTTGFTSRELFQIRENFNLKKGSDFYMVGGMGHSSMVALGISSQIKNEVICLDGDGSFLMHMGSLANIGFYGNKNFKHIVFNNFCHESVGGQETHSENIDIKNLALGSGYKNYYRLDNLNKIDITLKKFFSNKGPSILEIITKFGFMKNLVRPKNLHTIKKNFMNISD
jgi:phosphonopyruvate decarboxylase